jgi:hypothetical protein
MTIIAIQCPACRATDDVPAPALFVDVDAATGDEEAGATVTWVCGSCDELVSVPVAWAPLVAVVSAGASLIEAGRTTETTGTTETTHGSNSSDAEDVRPAHPESPTGGARLTPDDLLDFHQGLDGDHWLDDLCASAERQLGAGPA